MHKQFVQVAALAAVAACTLTRSLANAASAAGVRARSYFTPVLNGFDRAIYEKAGEGTPALRRDVEARRGFLQKGICDTAVWVAGVAETRKRCIDDSRFTANNPHAPSLP